MQMIGHNDKHRNIDIGIMKIQLLYLRRAIFAYV